MTGFKKIIFIKYKLISLLVLCLVIIGCGFLFEVNNNETTLVCGVKESVFVCGNIGRQYSPVFKKNCAACHKIDKQSTGPKLMGFLIRVQNENWIKGYLMSEDSLVKIKDSLVQIINKNGTMEFSHEFNSLSNEELNELILLME